MCEFCEKQKVIADEYTKGIAYIDSYGKLVFDNSGKEYCSGVLTINYCPLCGRKIEGGN